MAANKSIVNYTDASYDSEKYSQFSLNDKETMDFEMAFRTKTYQVHRQVLERKSYFQRMIKNMTSSFVRVHQPDISALIFEIYVRYTYSGEISLDRNNVTDVAKAANILSDDELLEHCENFFIDNLQHFQSSDLNYLAHVVNMPELARRLEASVWNLENFMH